MPADWCLWPSIGRIRLTEPKGTTMALRGNIALFVVVLSVAAVVAASGTPSPASPGFLTGPSSEKPLAIVSTPGSWAA